MNLKKKPDKNVTSATGSKHPKVSEMVLLAIAMLNERNGSSVQAIKKYISQFFNIEIKNLSLHVKKYLIFAVASGTLVQTKGKGAAGSFRLGGSMKFKMSELLARYPNQSKTEVSDSKSNSEPASAEMKKKKAPKKKSRRAV
ncbi:histone H1-like [Parasteatoda tepidariorum]|uniref:histone H1-like n=1 Tax=Parasteatoda tepidariorum TaxID=114398 RepID=UPI00077F9A1D|nr:histone H1, sperm-like [Parasteatoda tepidariorum]